MHMGQWNDEGEERDTRMAVKPTHERQEHLYLALHLILLLYDLCEVAS